MMSLLVETAGYIYNEVLRNTRYLVLTVDAKGVVVEQDCPGCEWTVDGVGIGRALPETLRAIVLSTPPEHRTQLYPYIYLGESLIVDVHVLKHGTDRQLILQDVTENHDAELKLQQKAHEISLLLEKQAELNRELELRRREAERASQAKSRFIASMSHEFRTPITSIMGHAELLARQDADSRLPGAIQRASWHLLTLVENLLEQARQGEGIVQLNPAPVNVKAVLQDMRDLFSLQAKSRGLELTITAASLPEMFETDELRLRQVLINLLSNALRYTDEGGVELEARGGDAALSFSISDTGPGITAGDQEKIFEAFTRLEPDRETGAGLGLAITRQLVTAMGGTLALDSEPGRGSTFSFSLPLGEMREPGRDTDISGIRALLVDDDPDVLTLYEILMKDWGIEVQTASGLQQARDMAGQRVFDLVITDLHLEDGLGTELLEQVRKQDSHCGTILCSGSGTTLPKATGGNADAYLLKPVRPERLRETITSVVGKAV